MVIRKQTGIAVLFALVVGAAMSAASAGEAGSEVLANADVVEMARAGLPDDLIQAKIGVTANRFDMSSRAIISLRENGVSDAVIMAMMRAAETLAAGPRLDETRFRTELANIASGTAEAKTSGQAWMLANRAVVLPALRNSLADSNPDVRDAALTVLARARDGDSLISIRNMLADPSPQVRDSAAAALVELGDGSAVTAAEQAVARQVNPLDGYARLLGYARHTPAAELLGRVVAANADPLNRAAAAWALGEIGRPGMAGRPDVEKALESDADPAVRREAALAVAKYQDSRAATLLEDACRRDPEVRKTTLAAMAEFPETVEFLVSVMNIPPDQIAADELETARNSLMRLTGQNYGLDGSSWQEWFNQNGSRFAAMSPSADAALVTAAPVTPFSSGPAPVGSGRRSGTGEVDIEAWSIIADPDAIPMAPQVEALASGPAAAPSAPSLPPGASIDPFAAGGFAGAPAPAAAAPVSAASLRPAAGFDATAAIPSSMPDLGLDLGVIGDAPAPAPGTLRTWTSDPERVYG
ncbi:MAG: HEAT repeat domain-containing protein, partial [Planctomycetes bacterium]|nr:HEAT repeat domain-containing protein [Planctomycetota bacterium]